MPQQTPADIEEGGFNLDNFPQVNAWMARVAAHTGNVFIDRKN